eukprot:6434343-Prymnesium_polylepis.1
MARSSTRRCGHFIARRPHALLATDACTASTLLNRWTEERKGVESGATKSPGFLLQVPRRGAWRRYHTTCSPDLGCESRNSSECSEEDRS